MLSGRPLPLDLSLWGLSLVSPFNVSLLHVVPSGLPDWGATRKCMRAHRAPPQRQPDGCLHRPHQALWMQLWCQGMKVPLSSHHADIYWDKKARTMLELLRLIFQLTLALGSCGRDTKTGSCYFPKYNFLLDRLYTTLPPLVECGRVKSEMQFPWCVFFF